jgi:hypothetical protein
MKNIFPALIILTLGWLLSGAVHELGHVIVGKMAGLTVDFIQLLPPGVGFSGKTSKSWLAALSIAGPLLPVLVGITGVLVIFLLKGKNLHIRYTVLIFLPMMMHSLMLLCTPIATAFGIQAANNDVTKFIELAGWSPLAVSVIGLLLTGFCGAVLLMVI